MVMNAKACVCVLMNAKTCVLDVTVASTGPSMPLMSVHACVVQIEARDAYARARTHTHTHRQQRRCKQNRNDCGGVSLGCSDN